MRGWKKRHACSAWAETRLCSGCAQPPERGDFPAARRRQWIAGIARLRMARPDVQACEDHEPASGEECQQFVPGPQAEVLRQVRQHQPTLTPWRQPLAKSAKEAAQHAA